MVNSLSGFSASIRWSYAGAMLLCLAVWLPSAHGETATADDPLAQKLSFAPRGGTAEPAAPAPRRGAGDLGLTTVIGGLAVCVGGFLLFVWATRRSAPKGLAPLPSEVLEPLGRAPLNTRHYLQLVRLGKKLILLNVSAQGAVPVGEVTDPDEVSRLAGLCQQSKADSISTSFRAVLGEAARGVELSEYPAATPPVSRERRPSKGPRLYEQGST
ncbi:MAG: FliO/MopB family protein [Pirellulaceae bacterium]